MPIASLTRQLFALALVVGALPAFGNETECSPAAFDKAAGGIAAPRDVLQAAIDGNDLDPDITRETSDAIVSLKRQLTALVDAKVACTTAAKLDTAALATTLNAAIAGGKKADEALLHVEPTLVDDKLSVVATIGVPCGSDALWLVYEKHGARWRRALRWTSPPYDRIDKAWGSFQFAVAPPGSADDGFVAVSHIRPWCTSSWSVIDYAIARPNAAADAPMLLLEGNDSIWWGGDDAGRLSVDKTHVDLRFHAASIDTGVHNREYVRRWEISGSAAKRVTPVASSARDFVEEWIVSPWTQAKHWSAPSPALAAAHRRLSAERERHDLVEFGSVLECGTNGSQIELRRDENDTATFFHVTGEPDYRMTAVADHADPACTQEVPASPDG